MRLSLRSVALTVVLALGVTGLPAPAQADDPVIPPVTLTLDNLDFSLTPQYSLSPEVAADVPTFVTTSGQRLNGVEDEGVDDLSPCVGFGQTTGRAYFVATQAECAALDALEQRAVDEVIARHGLAADRTYARTAARSEVRAQLWLILLNAIRTPAAQRTADEQTAVGWLTQVQQRYQVGVAEATLAEFEKFDADDGRGSCTYTPPAPYADAYPGSKGRWSACRGGAAARLNLFDIGPTYPEQSEFVTWGTAAASDGLPVARSTVLATQMSPALVSLAAGAASGVAVGATIDTLAIVAPTLARTLVQAVLPFALRAAPAAAAAGVSFLTGSGSLAGAASVLNTVAGPVGFIVSTAILVIVYTSLSIYNRETLGPNFRDALANARATTPDLPAMIGSDEGLTALFSLYSNWQALQPYDDPIARTVPDRTRADGAWSINGQRSDTLTVAGWDGDLHTTRIRGGYFVTDGVPSLSLQYLDPNGVKRRLYRYTKGDGVAFASVAGESEYTACDGTAASACTVDDRVLMRRAPVSVPDSFVYDVRSARNDAPTLDLPEPDRVRAAERTLLRADARDPEGDPLTTTWAVERFRTVRAGVVDDPCAGATAADRLSSSSCYVAAGTGAEIAYRFPSAGTYRVRATTTDGAGAPVTATRTITVLNTDVTLTRAAQCGSIGADAVYCSRLDGRENGQLQVAGTVVEPDRADLTTLTVTWASGVRDVATFPCGDTAPACNPAVTWREDGTARSFVVRRSFGAQPAPTQQVTVAARDGVNTTGATFTATYTVINDAPRLSLVNPSVAIQADEGSPVSFTTRIATSAASAAVSVDWGNGQVDAGSYPCGGTAPACAAGLSWTPVTGGFEVTATRTFPQNGIGAVTVTATANGVGSLPLQTNFFVIDVRPTGTMTLQGCPSECALRHRSSGTIVGHITDPGVDDVIAGRVLVGLWGTGLQSELTLVPAPGGGFDFSFPLRALPSGGGQLVTVGLRYAGDAENSTRTEFSYLLPLTALPGADPTMDTLVGDLSNPAATVTNRGSLTLTTTARASGGATVSGARLWLDIPNGGAEWPEGGVPMAGAYGAATVPLTATLDLSTLTAGRHELRYQTVDSFGRVSAERRYIFFVDRTGPTWNPVSQTSTTVTVNSQADLGIFQYAVQASDDLDGVVPSTCTPASGFQLQVGAQQVTCIASDLAGNAATYSFVVDTVVGQEGVAPTVQVSGVPARTSLRGADFSLRVDWEPRFNTRLGSVEAWVDDAAPTTLVRCCPTGSSLSLNTQLLWGTLLDGPHTLFVRATDDFGRVGITSVAFIYDSTGPVLSALPDLVSDATSLAGAAVAFDAPLALDAVDGARPVTCTPASGSTFALGLTTVTCTAADVEGRSTSRSFGVRVVKPGTAPVISALSVPAVVRGDRVPFSYRAVASGAGGTIVNAGARIVRGNAAPQGAGLGDPAVEVDLRGAYVGAGADGTYEFEVFAADSWQRVTSASVPVRVDNTAPVLTLPDPVTVTATSAAGRAVTYSATGSDTGDAALTDVLCSVPSGSVFPLGTTTVRCTTLDLAGNRTDGTFPVTVEGPGGDPTVELGELQSPTRASTLSLDVSAAVSAPGAVLTDLRAWFDVVEGDGTPLLADELAGDVAGEPGPASVQGRVELAIAGLADGAHELVVRATDSYGHTTTVRSGVRIDRTMPTLSAPASVGASTADPAGAPVDFTVTATDAGDAAAGAPAPVVSCTPAAGSRFDVGVTTVTCTATDAAGNTASASFPVTLTLVTDQPDLAVTLAARYTGADRVALSGTARAATESGRIESAVVHLDRVAGAGTPLTGTLGVRDAAFSGTVDLRGIAAGEHEVIVVITDDLGRQVQTSAALTIDRTPPLLAPRLVPAQVYLDGPGRVVPGASDTGSGIAAAACGSVVTTRAGLRTLVCRAVDRAGNRRDVEVEYLVGYAQDRLRVARSWRRGTDQQVSLVLTDNAGTPIAAGLARALSRDCQVRVSVSGALDVARVCLEYDVATRRFSGAVRVPGSAAPGRARVVTEVAYDGTRLTTSRTTTVSIAR